jgi:hypothetical protein
VEQEEAFIVGVVSVGPVGAARSADHTDALLVLDIVGLFGVVVRQVLLLVD